MDDRSSTSHTDDHATNNAPEDGNYSTVMEHGPIPWKDGFKDSEGRTYGAIELRGFDIHIFSPVDDVVELHRRAHLTAQFHDENSDHWDDNSNFVNDGGTLYDRAILEQFEEKLKCEDIDTEDPNIEIPVPRLKALFLRKARKMDGLKFHKYLRKTGGAAAPTLSSIGYEEPSDVPSYQTLQRVHSTVYDEADETIDGDAFDAAVTRAVFGVYRAGIVAPDAVKQKYGFDALEPPLDERNVSRDTEKAELREFVKLLFDLTTESLTFDRESEQTKHDMRAFVGACAASALYDAGIQNVVDICDWDLPRDQIPAGGWMHNYVSELENSPDEMSDYQFDPDDDSTPSVDEQFNWAHRLTLQLARLLGFWSESNSTDLGIDLFRVDWSGDSLDGTISRPTKSDNDDITEQWTFVIAGGVTAENRFVLGGRWLPEKSDYPGAVEEILENAIPPVALNSIVIDSEIVSGALIDTIREFVGEEWIISAPDSAVVKGLKRLTPANHTGFAPDVKWNTDSPPNLVTYPPEESIQGSVMVDPREIATDAIQNEEEGERISIPLKHQLEEDTPSQTSLDSDPDVPRLTDEFDDLESAPDIGKEEDLAAYFTDRSLENRSAGQIRSQYTDRWGIETTVDQIKNDFMPLVNSADSTKRLYGMHMGILLYNWHTLINRCVSPGGLRLDVTHQELLQAIQHVVFNES